MATRVLRARTPLTPAMIAVAQLEEKVLALHQTSEGIDELDEDWLLEMLPALKSLEPDTLETLLAQVCPDS